jgi:hypothetical protein
VMVMGLPKRLFWFVSRDSSTQLTTANPGID